MAWQDDYYAGSSDYPKTGETREDIDPEAASWAEDALARGGHLADDVAAVLLERA